MTQEASSKSTAQLLGDRKQKLKRLRDEFKLDPYGQRTPSLTPLADAVAHYDADADAAHKADDRVDDRPAVHVAGRVMQHRVMGNLIFLSLRDHTGDLQVAVSKKAVGQPYFGLAKMTDYGDLVTAHGRLGTTNTGEVTVWAQPPASAAQPQPEPAPPPESAPETPPEAAPTAPTPAPYAIATKSLALPPGKHHGLTDPETRYRKRYVDLYANPGVMQTMQLRIRIIDEMRNYLRSKGFLEVETPMLQTVHGGAAARPFRTHHHALDLPLTLRIAPELYLKRLLVGGFSKVFEINRNFRNEGISPRHNPEFTMLEAYEAYGNWETMAELVEDMVCTVAEKLFGTLVLSHEDAKGTKKTIDLTRPWRRVSMTDLVEERTGWKFIKEPMNDDWALRFGYAFLERERSTNLLFSRNNSYADLQPNLKELAIGLAGVAGTPVPEETDEEFTIRNERQIEHYASRLKNLSPAEQLTEVFEKLIEPTLIDPCYVTRVPSVIIPLAKTCADDDYFADVYELAINGVEISPGYTELNDPEVQEANFRGQVGDDEEKQQIDEDFLEALRVGMPPAGGMGLGIDRLVMMLTGAESIRDVILFPLMKPQGDGNESPGK
ncbi:MAG: amino acid--tRNA ligase-related protein [Planctomycetota bacterium]